MDLSKIGKFLRDLRCEQGLTQEELGEKLGATNKTISRWETGTYLPPAEMLVEISKLYNVSINEILSGERLSTADYQSKAEENIVTTINDNSKVIKRSKKIIVICLAVILALAIASALIIYFTADKNTYIYVTFDSNGGSKVETTVITISPDFYSNRYFINEPPCPTKSGYSFVGWFDSNDEQAERWNFRRGFSCDTTLYAKWEPATDGIEYEEYQFYNGMLLRGYAVVGCGTSGLDKINDEHVIIPSYYNGLPVYAIKNYAFCALHSMRSVAIPDTVIEITQHAFAICNNLADIQFGSGVQIIGESAFYDCKSLRKVTLPASLQKIGRTAFANCTNLQSVVIPDNVESIEERAFEGCYSLVSVTLGLNTSKIDVEAFKDCCNLVEVHDMCKYINVVDNISAFPYALDVYKNDADSTNIYLTGDGYAFYDLDGEPQLIRYVGDENSITLPSDCKGKPYTLRDKAFAYSDLFAVTIGGNVQKVSSSAFAYCKNLAYVTLLDGVTEIGGGAFEGSSLQHIEIPNSVTEIGGWAFASCNSLNSITIPDDVTTISYYTFAFCRALKKVTLPSNLVCIDGGAFNDCVMLEELRIPSSVQMLSYAFSNCIGLKTIEVDEGNSEYHSEGNCLIATISKTLILACLDSVIPTDGSVTRIANRAFQNFSKLKSLYIPASITEIEDGAFNNCTLLVEITVDEANTSYEVSNNCLISIADHKLIALMPKGIIPDDGKVTSIGSRVIMDASITKLEIPKSVTQIAYDAFVFSGDHKIRLKYDGTMKECAENTEYGKDVTELQNVICIECTDGELYRRWVD